MAQETKTGLFSHCHTLSRHDKSNGSKRKPAPNHRQGEATCPAKHGSLYPVCPITLFNAGTTSNRYSLRNATSGVTWFVDGVTVPNGSLPKSEQLASDTLNFYLKLAKAEFDLVQEMAKWHELKTQAESGYLSRVDNLASGLQDRVAALGDNLAPATSKSMAKAVEAFYEAAGTRSVPSLNSLFRDLHVRVKTELLEGYKRGDYVFKITSHEGAVELGSLVRKLTEINEKITSLNNKIAEVGRTKEGRETENYHKYNRELVDAQKTRADITPELEDKLTPIRSDELTINVNEPDQAQSKKPLDQPAKVALVVPAAVAEETIRAYRNIKAGEQTSAMSHATTGLAIGIFVAQIANLLEIRSKSAELARQEDYDWLLTGSFTSTIGAAFGVAHVISNNAVTARAERLASAFNSAGETSAYATLGKLHVSLGAVTFLAGFVGSTIATYQYTSKAADALKRGDFVAMSGALVAGAGSVGSAALNGWALGRIGGYFLELRKRPSDLLGFWVNVGSDMAKFVARLTLWDLGFLGVQILGSGIYDYFNLSPLDKWLQSTPWSKTESLKEDLSLEQFQARLLDCTDIVSIERSGEPDQACINLYSVPGNALENSRIPGENDDFSIHISAGVIFEHHTLPFLKSEDWIPRTKMVTDSLSFDRSGQFLRLKFDYPYNNDDAEGDSILKTAASYLVGQIIRGMGRFSIDDFFVEITILREDERWDRPVKYYRFRGSFDEKFTLLPDDDLNADTSKGRDAVILKDPMHIKYE